MNGIVSNNVYLWLVRARESVEKLARPVSRIDAAYYVRFNTASESYSKAVEAASKELFGVAKKSKTAFKWNGYVNVDILKDDMEDARAFIGDTELVSDAVVSLIQAGYHVKLYKDDSTDSPRCNIICHDPDSPNFGYCLSAWGKDWYQAMGAVCFKHYRICDGDWQEYSNDGGGDFG